MKEAPVNGSLFANLIRSIDCYPVFSRLKQIKSLYFAYVCGAADLIQIPVFYNYKPRGACSIIKLGKLAPCVELDVIYFNSFCALLDVPRTDHNNVLIFPAYHSMCIPGVIHVHLSFKEPRLFAQLIGMLDIGFSVSHAAAGQEDCSFYLNTLAIP